MELKAKELAKELGISLQTVYNWIYEGMPHYFKGCNYRFDLEAVKEWAKEQKPRRPENFREFYIEQKKKGVFDKDIAAALGFTEWSLIGWKRKEGFKKGDFRYRVNK